MTQKEQQQTELGTQEKKFDYGPYDTVPLTDRIYKGIDLFSIWFGANAVATSWWVGAVAMGIGFLSGTWVLVLVGPIIYIFVTMISIMGFKTGRTTMALTRSAFGIRGTLLPSVVNTVGLIGWTGVNSVISGISWTYIMNWALGWPVYGEPGYEFSMATGVVLFSLITLVIVLFGRQAIGKFELASTLLMVVLIVYVTYVLFTHWDINQLLSWRAATPYITVGAAVDAIVAYSIGWFPCAADYSRHGKTFRGSSWACFAGLNISQFWFAITGAFAVIATALTIGEFNPAYYSDPTSTIVAIGAGLPVLFIIIFTVTTTNVVALYSAAQSAMNLSRKLKPRLTYLAFGLIALIYVVIAVYTANALDFLEAFLNFIGLTLAPILSIMLVDYFIVRRKTFSVSELDKKGGKYWYSSGVNILTFAVWATGTIIYIGLLYYVPAIYNSTGAAFPTLGATAIIYYIATKMFPKYYNK